MSAQETPTFTATTRTATGHKVKQLRREGLLPAVIYGNIKESRSLSLDAHTFTKLYIAAGTSTLINLTIDAEKPIKVLVHDVMIHPTRDELTHVDFYAVNLKEKLTTEVPLNFIGTAPAVEIDGGIFVTIKSELEIECLPDNLPQHIDVDISALVTFDDSIRIKDIVLPTGVTATGEEEEVIAAITEPISEAELDALDEAPATEPTTEFETTSGTEKPVEDEKAA
jgi:large subunit ribosomal protein L25